MTDAENGSRISRRGALALMVSAGTAIELLPAADVAQASNVKQVVMLVRHGEKPVGSGPPFGIDSNGNQDPESLIVLGWERAGALVELFNPKVGKLRPGIYRPESVFASDPGTSGSKRPLETVTPVAASLGVTVKTPVKDKETSKIAHILAKTKGVSLAGWQHQHIPSIAQHLGTAHPKPPTKWPGDRFDIVWVFTRSGGGSWTFSQVPQLLLAGDEHSVIK